MNAITPTSLIRLDETSGIRVESFEGSREIVDRDALGLVFRVQLSPGAAFSRATVVLDPLIGQDFVSWGFRTLERYSADLAVPQIALAALSAHLDRLSPGEELAIRTVDCWSECLESLGKRHRVADDAILHYLKGKLHWAWKYDLRMINLFPLMVFCLAPTQKSLTASARSRRANR